MQQPKQRKIPGFFCQPFHYLKCCCRRLPGVFLWHNILFRHCRITTIIQRWKVRQLHKCPFFFCTKLFSQIFQLISCNGDPIFQLTQIFISRHPEMTDLPIVIKINLQIQHSEKQSDYVLPLPYYQYIFIPFLT